jgi:hypothetical protein
MSILRALKRTTGPKCSPPSALVKSLVQRLNERADWGHPLEGKKGLRIEAKHIFQGVVREINLVVQDEVLPTHRRTGGDSNGYLLTPSRWGIQ